MEINEFIDIFIESFDEAPTEISAETKFKELEFWTSMQALLLIAHIDDTIEVVLSADDIKQAISIQDLFILVTNKM